MKKLAIYPHIRQFKDGEHQWGYSMGWLYDSKERSLPYYVKFGVAKTREEAETALRKKHPDVEIVHLDEMVDDRDSNEPMHMTFSQFEELMNKFDEALEKRRQL